MCVCVGGGVYVRYKVIVLNYNSGMKFILNSCNVMTDGNIPKENSKHRNTSFYYGLLNK